MFAAHIHTPSMLIILIIIQNIFHSKENIYVGEAEGGGGGERGVLFCVTERLNFTLYYNPLNSTHRLPKLVNALMFIFPLCNLLHNKPLKNKMSAFIMAVVK